MCAVSLLKKQKTERSKYVNAISLMNLIAFETEERIHNVASYLISEGFDKKVTSYYIDAHTRISKDNHCLNSGFDLNTRDFLHNCYSYGFLEKYIVDDSKKDGLQGDFYYLIDDLKTVDCIESLNVDFSKLAEVRKAVVYFHKEQKDSIFRPFESDHDNPNPYQKLYMQKSSFDVISAACLLAGTRVESVKRFQNHQQFIELYSDYISYKLMIELAVNNNELDCIDGVISAADLQHYLFKTGYVIKGFNDWLAIEPAKPLKEIKQDVELGEHQKSLIAYDAFTPDQIICLIINYDPSYVVRDAKYLSYWNLVNDAVDANQLLPFDQQMNIPAEQVKTWLASNGYVYKGFNDKTPIEQSETIRKLTEQLAAAHATIKQLTDERDEAASLENKLVEKVEAVNDDLEQVHHKSFKTVDRIMYAMAEIIDINNTKPYSKNKGSLNEAILSVLAADHLALGYEPIGDWLSRVNALKSVDKISKEIERFKK